jgi:nitrite reductase/ring-hydroxylating ferredoxin subunit
MTSRISRRRAISGAATLGVAMPALASCGADEKKTPATASSNGDSSGPKTIAITADIPEGGGVIFAEADIVITQPTAGEFKGFTNICTHQQCPVGDVTDTINCPCHGSQFSIADGSNVTGPGGSDAGSTAALAEINIKVTGDKISKA